MPQERKALLAFNRGILSTYGIARIDLNRTALSAEEMTNWVPRVLGSMALRPGWQYIGATYGNAVAKTISFIFATDDTAQLELTDSILRVRIDDELVTRESVSAAVTNGDFDTDLTGWTDNDESGAASTWATGGYLSLVGTGTNSAILDQQVTVTETGTEHALRIVIQRGPVTLKVGSSSGTDDYVRETSLGTGTHSLAFTPTGNFYIRLSNVRIPASLVDSVNVESAGVMTLPTPWDEDSLQYIRTSQSGDIVYVACDGFQQRKIERRSETSWSIVLYEPEAGPFLTANITAITLTPSAITGDITLTASKALFRSSHVGALFRMASTGQLVTASLTGEDQFTDPIRVTGVELQRVFSVSVTGTFTATVTLQYSVAEPGSWVDVKDYTTASSESYDDTFDNQIIYYRIGIKAGDYTSGTATAQLSFASGSITGIVRITAYSSSTSVSARVLTALGNTTGVSDWSEGAWSDYRGWPSAVALREGRLDWFGKDKAWCSVSDDFENFDDDTEGDSGPISRSIGEGPVDRIHWALPLKRLMIGTGGAELSVRSSALDEPLTPTNFNIKVVSTQGSKSGVVAAQIDNSGVYVQKSGQKLMELGWDTDAQDYKSDDLSLVVPDLNSAGIVHVAVQRQPDTRIHCVRSDGTVGMVVFDRAENVICWLEIETDGYVEDVSVLPGTGEDQVYYVVRRTINGSTVRYVEKWAKETECDGRPVAYLADAHYRYSSSLTTTISGLDHLEGEEVVVWGWNTVTPFTDQYGNAIGRDFGTFTVSGGEISGLSASVNRACVGLAYSARFKSMKQAFAAALGTPLGQKQRINQAVLLLKNTHCQGIQVGGDFDNLDDIPLADVPQSAPDAPDTDHVFDSYDQDLTGFNDAWSTDSRVCMTAASPRPATVLACVISLTTHG